MRNLNSSPRFVGFHESEASAPTTEGAIRRNPVLVRVCIGGAAGGDLPVDCGCRATGKPHRIQLRLVVRPAADALDRPAFHAVVDSGLLLPFAQNSWSRPPRFRESDHTHSAPGGLCDGEDDFSHSCRLLLHPRVTRLEPKSDSA